MTKTKPVSSAVSSFSSSSILTFSLTSPCKVGPEYTTEMSTLLHTDHFVWPLILHCKDKIQSYIRKIQTKPIPLMSKYNDVPSGQNSEIVHVMLGKHQTCLSLSSACMLVSFRKYASSGMLTKPKKMLQRCREHHHPLRRRL